VSQTDWECTHRTPTSRFLQGNLALPYPEHRLKRLQKYELAQRLAEIEKLDTETRDAFKSKSDDLANQVRTIEACQRVMVLLAFDSIHDRQEAIHDSHADTCAWIYTREDLGFKKWASEMNGESLHLSIYQTMEQEKC
jgi:hypothetical protein